MTAVEKTELISVADYLAAELASPVKHEYVGGVVYAMSGSTNAHSAISTNLIIALGGRLRGKRCRPFTSDTKIRILLPTQTRFYYPDVSVVCNPGPPDESFQDQPVVLIEVLSRSTRRVDLSEKKDAYLTISSLSAYLLVEQDSATVTAFRRTEQGFVRETYQGLEAVIPLPEIGVNLPLSEIYETMQFVPEPSDEPDRS